MEYHLAVAAVAAGSNMVPDWFSAGTVPRFCNSYQRTPLRLMVPVPVPTPDALTDMLWAVHNLPFLIIAAYSRSSNASRFPFVPPVFPK